MVWPNFEAIFSASFLFSTVINVLAQHAKLPPRSRTEMGLFRAEVVERVQDLAYQTANGVFDTVAGHRNGGIL